MFPAGAWRRVAGYSLVAALIATGVGIGIRADVLAGDHTPRPAPPVTTSTTTPTP
jgi:hypothetical protein